MNPTDTLSPPNADRLAQLQRRVRKYRPLHPIYLYAFLLCMCIGGAASTILIRDLCVPEGGSYTYTAVSSNIRDGCLANRWSYMYEEAGFLWNLCFWGSYLIGLGVLLPVSLVRQFRNGEDVQEIEREIARRRK